MIVKYPFISNPLSESQIRASLHGLLRWRGNVTESWTLICRAFSFSGLIGWRVKNPPVSDNFFRPCPKMVPVRRFNWVSLSRTSRNCSHGVNTHNYFPVKGYRVSYYFLISNLSWPRQPASYLQQNVSPYLNLYETAE